MSRRSELIVIFEGEPDPDEVADSLIELALAGLARKAAEQAEPLPPLAVPELAR